jgi:single-strand DNA-binding protein
VNCVTLIGNLATDVELKELGEDRAVANFVLAVNRLGANEKADFVRISVWNKQAEACSRFISKGQKVGVEGRLRCSQWEDDEGKKRSAVDVVASRVEFLGGGPAAEAPADDIPFEAAAA